MTSAFSDGADEPPISLQQLISETQHNPSPRIAEFTRLAAAAQSERRTARASDTDRITRSTALWTLTQMDDGIREALLTAGLDSTALGGVLSVRSIPRPSEKESAGLNTYFASAMRSYLATLPGEFSIGLTHLTAAILMDARDKPSGLLPDRLRVLGVDLDVAIREIHRLLAEVDQVPRRTFAQGTEFSPDAPAAKDLLGRERLAEALADRVKRLTEADSPSNSSFLVHVDGPWGAGKSTLFEFLKHQFGSAFLVVPVNAWREQRVGVQWWTLLSALRGASAASRPWYGRPLVWFAGLVDRIRAGWVPFVAAVLVLGAVLVALLSLTDIDLTASAQTADSVLKIVSLAAASFAGLVAAARYLLPGSGRSAQGFVETNANPMDEVRRLFVRTLRRTKKGRPVVFLIDDLDRCDEGYVVEFLEVMQTLVRDATRLPDKTTVKKLMPSRRQTEIAGPYAFIAADGRWIRSSYETHYAAFQQTAVPGRPLGYLFLEKIFQLRFRLPSITTSAKEAFFASLLLPGDSRNQGTVTQEDVIAATKAAVHDAQTESEVIEAARGAKDIYDPSAKMDVLGDAAVRFSERSIDDSTEHALARFGVFLEPNPRSMKLFVNTYGVLRTLRTLEEVFVPSGPLALWTVIEIRWPYLADYLRSHPDAAEPGASDRTVPDDVAFLLASEDVLRVLGDIDSGPMTPALIRQCAGIS